MQITATKWGNSLGLRIPRDIARQLGLGEGSQMDITAEAGRIIIVPAKPRYRLEDLVADLDPNSLRDAFDWGPDRGREIIE
jgi:antitoxin MazE